MNVEERQEKTNFINGLIKEWKQELKEILNDKKLKASKEDEALISLGIRFDEKYKESGYIKGFLNSKGFGGGFERKIKQFIENGKQIKSRTSTELEKPFETKYQKQLITDRAFNLLSPEDIKGDFNYRVKWIHDVIFSKFRSWIEEDRETANILKYSSSELPALVNHFKKLSPILPEIKFTDKEFREVTGLKHLSSKELHKLARDYTGLRLDGDLAYWEKENGYEYLTLHESLGGFVSRETGELSRRGKKPQFEHVWIWHYAGFLLFHNLLLKKYTNLPKKFYKMKAGSQEIYRKVAQFTSSNYSISTISKIIGYKKEVSELNKQRFQNRKLQIISYLEELKENKLIWNYEIKGKRKDLVFSIFRIKPVKELKR